MLEPGSELDTDISTQATNNVHPQLDGTLTSPDEPINNANADVLDGDDANMSFDVISSTDKSNITLLRHDDTDSHPSNGPAPTTSGSRSQQKPNNNNNNNDSDINNQLNQSSSFGDRMRKSGSFLARLQQSSSDPKDANPSIPATIASAFSSFSSFTSNFGLNASNNSSSSSANNNNNNNNNQNNLSAIETSSDSTRLSQVSESREDFFNKKAALERKNLINLTKLIVRDLISSCLLVRRTIEDDCGDVIHLNSYFTLIDRVLKHGLKQNLLTNRSSNLWNALDNLPKYLKESTLMSESVRSLAHTKTADGKIKAWMRLALMQKKLPQYFNELLANKNVLLKDIYHDYAFMLNDEAQVFAGLIIGVNVIDCNFFVKDANFDQMEEIIDLSPYLRTANSLDGDALSLSPEGAERAMSERRSSHDNVMLGSDSLEKILDQKNYLEEWNTRLESTISNLQYKIKTLTEQNSKLEMEAKLNEAKICKLQTANGLSAPSGPSSDRNSANSLAGALKNLVVGSNQTEVASTTTPANVQPRAPSAASVSDSRPEVSGQEGSRAEAELEANQAEGASQDSVDKQSVKSSTLQTINPESPDAASSMATDLETQQHIAQLERELAALRERTGLLEASYRSALDRIKSLERDLDIQTSMNADKETTIKMYVKDLKDKQAQVDKMRVMSNEANKLNSDLTERLNDTSAKIKERSKSLTSLQASLDKCKLESKSLVARLQDKQSALATVKSELEKASANLEQLKQQNSKLADELARERASCHSSSQTLETQTTRISELSARVKLYEQECAELRGCKRDFEQLSKKCQDYEQSLEEIGAQLRESRLEAETLKENSAVFLDSQWMDSKQVKACALCQQSFSVTRRKHHCRLCGNVFCQTCSDNKMELASSSKPVRVCDTCHAFLLAKFVRSANSAASTA